jgi:hypothetical protein
MTRGLELALAGVVVGLGLALVPAASSAATPGFDYLWSQPPASVPIGPVRAFHPVSAYHWAQPGTARVTTKQAQPPARIPVA